MTKHLFSKSFLRHVISEIFVASFQGHLTTTTFLRHLVSVPETFSVASFHVCLNSKTFKVLSLPLFGKYAIAPCWIVPHLSLCFIQSRLHLQLNSPWARLITELHPTKKTEDDSCSICRNVVKITNFLCDPSPKSGVVY
jgi:hypothetical protein